MARLAADFHQGLCPMFLGFVLAKNNEWLIEEWYIGNPHDK